MHISQNFSRLLPKGRIVGLSSERIFNFAIHAIQCQVVLPIYTRSCSVILCPCWLPDIFRLLNFANPAGGKWSLTVLLICVSLITSELEHYYMFLGHSCVFCWMSLSFFCWFVFFFSWIIHILHIFWIFFLGIFIINVFSQLVVCLFILSIHPAICEDKFIILLVKFIRLVLNFYFCILFKKKQVLCLRL